MFCTRMTGTKFWMLGASSIGSGTAIDTARETPDALYCDSESGTCESKQHDVSDASTSFVPVSSMFMCSQRDCVSGVAHSASFEEKSAQAGVVPRPIRFITNPKISTRRTTSQSGSRTPPLSNTVS
jgi:hypothetical protein